MNSLSNFTQNPEVNLGAMFQFLNRAYALVEVICDEPGKSCDLVYRDTNRLMLTYLKYNPTGKKASEIPVDTNQPGLELYKRILQADVPDFFDFQINSPGNQWFNGHVFQTEGAAGKQYIIIIDDVTQHKAAEAEMDRALTALHESQAWLEGQQQAFKLAMSGQPLSVSLDALIQTVIAQSNGKARAAFYMIQPSGKGLHLTAGMNEAYAKDVNGFKVGPESLACGLAMHTGAPVLTKDVKEEPRWALFLDLARKHNYRACWSFPVKTDGGPVLGTFAIYFKEPRDPKPRELELAEVLAHAAAIIISRHIELQEREAAQAALGELTNRQQFIQRLSDGLGQLADPVEIQEFVTHEAMKYFNSDRCYYCEVENGDAIIRRDAAGPGLQSVSGIYPLNQMPLFESVINAGKTFMVPDVASSKFIDDTLRSLCLQLQVISFMDVPVIRAGKPVGILCIVQSQPRVWDTNDIALAEDIANRTWEAVERASAEKAVQESEQKYRAIFNSVNEGFCLVEVLYDEDGKPYDFLIVDANPAQLRIFNNPAAVGENLKNRMPGLEKLLLPHYKQLVKTGLPLYFEKWLEHTEKWYNINASRVGAEGSQKIALVFANVTERKQMEAATETMREAEDQHRDELERAVATRTTQLEESRDLLQGTLDSALDMIQVFQAVRDHNGRIVDFKWILNNHTSERIYGEVVGKSLLQSNPGVVDEGIFAHFAEVTESGIPQHYEKHYVHEQFDGWFHQSVVKLGDGVATSTADITERKLAEARIKQMEAEKQQEIVRVSLTTLEEERYRISESLHNGLGQLLYGIKISLGGLTREVSASDFDKIKLYTDRLLVDAIRESRRISHELMPAILEEFGLKAAVEDICQQFQSGIEFKCRFHRHKGLVLEKYLELVIYRTIQELMLNVVKHAEATSCVVDVNLQLQKIELRVSDNGRGLASSQHEPQSGIGLTAIRSRIKLLNGTINFNSRGKGTTVEVTIPMPRPVIQKNAD